MPGRLDLRGTTTSPFAATRRYAAGNRGGGQWARRLSLRRSQESGWYRHLDLIATILLAVATVLTAWSAFQSSQWGGVQAIAYSAASRERAESNQAATLAGQQTTIDVMLFTDWLAALHEEGDAVLPEPYVPDPEQYSGFLFERFRPEFKPAVHAWLAEDPLTDPDAPPSPFAMDEYVLASTTESVRLDKASERSAAAGPGRHRAQGQLRAGHRPVRVGALLLRHRLQAGLPPQAHRDDRDRRRRPAQHRGRRW